MKIFKLIQYTCVGLGLSMGLQSCNDMLDIRPESNVTPSDYLWEESQLGAYAITQYGALPINEPYSSDNSTDLQTGQSPSSKYIQGEWKVPQTGGAWEFSGIHNANYFLNTVIPRKEQGLISGNPAMIDHYIGEMYFFRALQHFNKLSSIGDAPILKTTFPDNKERLIAESKRMPRTELARFIISDLDSAILLMQQKSPDQFKNRLSKPVAQLLKSRVALLEGTWLKYFKDTPFVPNGPNWPGKDKEYNKNFEFAAGSIENEMNWFLEQALDAAQAVADKYTLTENTGILPQGLGEYNPYVEMYGATNMSGYEEVLLWKAYDRGLGITNNIAISACSSNFGIGMTRGLVDSYLMKNGLPIYASGSQYSGDESIGDIRKNRDDRAFLFLKEPNQTNLWINLDMGTHGVIKEPFLPNITSGSNQFKYTTGYTNRKGVNPDKALYDNWGGNVGCIVYRSAEAYLNYIEAYYERYGQLNDKATQYWKDLRNRAGVSDDINKTIQATVVLTESQTNWSAYSKGELIDATLFNIRRERSSEFVAEGLRMLDLRRWRSLDQLQTTPFQIEGLKIWGDYYAEAYAEAGKTDETYNLSYGIDDPKSNVSAPELSKYLRPYQVAKTLAYDGYIWKMAHYLDPIAVEHFLITDVDGKDVSKSPLYQNPYWPLVADKPAEK